MGKYIKDTKIEVQEMEITNIELGIATIRLQGITYLLFILFIYFLFIYCILYNLKNKELNYN